MSRRKRDMPLRGDRLKAKREEHGLSQEALAVAVNTTRRQISRYEHERSEPGADILARLAINLYCSADYLLGLSELQTGHGPEVDPASLAFAIRFGKLPDKKRRLIISTLETLEKLG